MWVRLDDRMPDHPKVRGCDLNARWLYIKGLCYAGAFLTDGLLRTAEVAALAGELKRPKAAIQQLVTAGLWLPVEGGYAVHDFLVYNPTRAAVLAEREATRRRVEAWRLK